MLLVWAWMCCRTRWMSSVLVRSICSSVSLGEQLRRSSWAPGLCRSSTLANTRKPMMSKCRAVACPKPESHPERDRKSLAVASDSHCLSPALKDALALPLRNPRNQTPTPNISFPSLRTTLALHPAVAPDSPGRALVPGTRNCCFLSLPGGRKHSLYLQPGRPERLPDLRCR